MRGRPVAVSQTRAVPSKLLVATRAPSGLKLALETSALCLSGGDAAWPVAAFQSRAAWSKLVVATRVPSGLKTTSQMPFSWCIGPTRARAGVAVPDHRVAVEAAGDEALAVGGVAGVVDDPILVQEGKRALPVAASQMSRRCRLPPRSRLPSVGAEDGGQKALVVNHRLAEDLMGSQFPNPGLVACHQDDPPTLRAEAGRVNRVLPRVRLTHRLPVGGGPHPARLVVRRGHDRPAIRRERDGVDLAAVLHRWAKRRASAAFQSRAVVSVEAVATVLPSGLNSAARTWSACRRTGVIRLPRRASQTCARVVQRGGGDPRAVRRKHTP